VFLTGSTGRSGSIRWCESGDPARLTTSLRTGPVCIEPVLTMSDSLNMTLEIGARDSNSGHMAVS